MNPWIEIEGLHLSRGGRPVLQGISAVLDGQAVGLVGANGAGKSTLIGALLGVLRANRGRVRVLGLDLPREAREVRVRAGVMAEQAGVFPGGSGVDAVTFAGTLSGLPRREALRRSHRALDALDVGEERYRPTAGYSTGMRQRCKLAMALVHDPEVLVLDEPTVGLDPTGRLQFLALIRDLRDQGRRILLSTHLLPDAEYVCDQMLLLEGGMVGYTGPIHSLLHADSGHWIADGSGFTPAFARALAERGIVVRECNENRVAFDAAEDRLAAFWSAVVHLDAEVRRLNRDAHGLEEAVIEIMGGGSAPSRGGGRSGR